MTNNISINDSGKLINKILKTKIKIKLHDSTFDIPMYMIFSKIKDDNR